MSVVKCMQTALSEITRLPDTVPEKPMLEAAMRQIIADRDVSDAVKFAKAQRQLGHLEKADLRYQLNEQLREQRMDRMDRETNGFQLNRLRHVIDLIEESADPTIARGRSSVAARATYLERRYMQELSPVMDQYFSGMLVARPKDTANLSRAMLGHATDDPQAQAAAQQIQELFRDLRGQLRDAGVFVEEIPNYRPQGLSPGRLAANKDRALREMASLLDPKYHPDPEVSAAAIYSKLQRRHTLEPGEQPLTMGREVHYRTDVPDRLHAFLEEFGEDTLLRQVQRQVRRHTRALALAEEFGPDPGYVIKQTLRNFSEKAAEAELPLAQRARTESAIRGAQSTYDVISGTLDTPQNILAANVMSGLRALMTPLYLGRVALAILGTDSLIAPLQRARVHGFGRAFSLQAQGMMGMMSRDTRARLREYYASYESMLFMGSPNSRFSNDPVSEGFAAKMQSFGNAVYRLTGAWDVEQGLRQMTAFSIGKGLAASARVPWDQLDPRLRQDMQSGGITEGLWKQINDQAVIDSLGLLDWRTLPHDSQVAFGAYFHRTLDHTVLRPDNYTRAILFAGGRRGSLPGELAAGVTQFLNWPISFTRIAMQQQWKRGKPGFLVFSGALFAGGMITEQLYALSGGEPAYEWDSATLFERAARRSGLLTPLGEWLYGGVTGNQFMQPSLGPVADTVFRTLERTGRISMRLLEDETDKAAIETIRLARQLTPNVSWFEAGIVAPVVQDFEELLDPDSVRRTERRFREEERMGFQ